VALALLFFATSAQAASSGSGSIVLTGKTAALANAFAYHHPASYDKSVIQSTIVLSSKPIDVGKVRSAADIDKAVHAWLDEAKAAYWEVIFYPDGTEWSGTAALPGVLTYNGTACKVTLTRNEPKRMEGTCRSEDENEKKNLDGGVFVDVKFDVDL
jgi:hypothetical protein